MQALSDISNRKKVDQSNNLISYKKTTNEDIDGSFHKILTGSQTNKTNPADSGFQKGDFKWGEKDLISYYDVNKDGTVDEKDISEGLVKPKDINHDSVLDLKDFVQAFTVAISKDKEPNEYAQYHQVAQNAFKLKDLNNDGVINIKDWDADDDKKVSGKELMEKMDLNHDGVFTAEDTKIRQQIVFGQK